MKKIFGLFAAMLMSASMFASVDEVPSDAVLADYYEAGQLCVCVYFQDTVCNDIVFAGSHNGWDVSDPSSLPTFEAVDGYDGWMVVAVTDESEEIQGKPVQLKSDGSFAWDYQTGDAESWTLVRGSVNIIAGFSGEADLKGYSTAQPVVLVSAYWKNGNSPCVSKPKHDYSIVLDAPLCANPTSGEYYAPAIIGSFNEWSEGVAMTLNTETMKYEYTLLNAEEGTQFKFKATTDTDWSNQIQLFNDSTSEWYDNPNITLDSVTLVELDYSEGRYTLCAEETAVENVEATKATAEKFIENGTLYIRREGIRYNALGQIAE